MSTIQFYYQAIKFRNFLTLMLICLFSVHNKYIMSKQSFLNQFECDYTKYSKIQSAGQIMGQFNVSRTGHNKFHNKQFVPFTTQRNIRGQIIKNRRPQKHLRNFSDFSEGFGNLNMRNDPTQNKKTLIDCRFKFNEINHFRSSSLQSHFERVPRFKSDIINLVDKDYQIKNKEKRNAQNLIKTTSKSCGLKQNRNLTSGKISKHESVNSTNFRQEGVPRRSYDRISQKLIKLKLTKSSLQTNKNIMNGKTHKNPQLQQIELQVKVHFNHPELQRLKQSRKLTYKFIQNLSQGDNKFKQKTQQFKSIKERIKKEMSKF